jgi:thiol-disulfide isomerase/thioredoxin
MNKLIAMLVMSTIVGTATAQGIARPEDFPEAASSTLQVGSDAPEIKATSWVKGKEVKEFEKGKGYVVEFWATWCGPCIANIPHLTDLQKKHRDVTFIGMASSERKPQTGRDDRLQKVQNFVRSQGAKMNYTVAYDADREMNKLWMQAAGQNGIPCAFVVDTEGKIAFIGHPGSDEFETKVGEVAEAAKKAAAEAKSDKSKSKSKKKSKKKETEAEKPETDSPAPAPVAPAQEEETPAEPK